MDLRIEPAGALKGKYSVPGDKSISHRAVMLGAIAEGDTLIENFLPGEDCLSTIDCMRKLGIEIEGPDNAVVKVHGRGLDGLAEPEDILDAGNSGTTMRLLLGILAGQPFFSVITGDASLRRRPMARVTEPLGQMGAQIEGRQGSNLAPLAVRGGNLTPFFLNSAVASAQVKSAVLLAGLYAKGATTVTEPYRSRDHTERMLEYFGADVEVNGNHVWLSGRPCLKGQKVVVPGDISSAAFLIVAASVVPGSDIILPGVGVNPTRSGILDVLWEMGADIELLDRRDEGGEPVADIRARYTGKLSGVTVGGETIPRLIDEVPVLAVAAALAGGVTIIKDAAELKVKESDRIATVAAMLGMFGADVEQLPDGLLVRGGRQLKGAVCESHGDHRIAMAAAVTGLAAEGETVVRGAECIDVSFPGFETIIKSILK
ncbi:3-phosphoshikimate 1-carboxyvinyltransferase [Pelotomaculum isophthalicicum JI]|uniref:3-phosphoshikimate 1-carboxyvinyltransferase n=1 Tax=Pelotomaculum isophthalicicum JI TaxID=947010 RepID=A0A9X4JVF4_9FIRM|nr:3-phosphoshikimate 1-carboxyvinyltransferase [Pelotomaculum isophthalicicum]MDF9407378.1 3-phosphoshikimate 1-carboxyvinyltransferase [Pelotomaculum isophthalicicum JI]